MADFKNGFLMIVVLAVSTILIGCGPTKHQALNPIGITETDEGFIIKEAEEKGYVQTVLGRRRYIAGINTSNYQIKSEAQRMAINMPVQGTASDIIKVAMIKIQQRINALELKTRMILQVHDELVFEVPRGELMEIRGIVQEIMPGAIRLSVPVKVDIKIGKNWGEMELS